MFLCTQLCLCFVLTAAQLSPGKTQEDKEARAAITKVLDDQVVAWNKGDLLTFMAGYHKSNELTFYSGGTVLKGWDATLERYQKKYQGEGKEMGKVTFKDLDIQVLSADTAFVRGRWDLKTSKDNPGGLFTLVFRKTPEGWRIIHDHTSNN